jgi:Mg2+-importing ATPase
LDEIPYDFERKRLSVLVASDAGPMLITKGAFTSVLEVSSTAVIDGATVALGSARLQVEQRFAKLSAQGYRVLGLATRPLSQGDSLTVTDECDMTLCGLLAFADPPKAGARDAVDELTALGVSVRLITGDNQLAARQIAIQVGLADNAVLTGAEIDEFDDATLAVRARSVAVFAEVEPLHKERLVRALQAVGETVGFLGDGINDAAALQAADVGISVDTAVDVAKQSAAIVLLDKSLAVIADGIRLGRQTFANTLKYVRVTTSANFGNMLSMAAAAAFLPFLPLLPRQILLLNFLTDIPGTTIAADAVDPEQLERPRAWDIRAIRRFMIAFGLVSSAFDILTFVILRVGFDAGATLFRSSWFLESTATELAVMLVLRTSRPFWRSRPGRTLLVTSGAIAVIALTLPYSPFADSLGFVAVPPGILAALISITAGYVAANEIAKRLAPALLAESTVNQRR